MIYGMYLSCMGAMVESAKHDTTANNLANTQTAGFKPDFAIFKDIPAESVKKGLGRRESDLILEKTGGGVWMDRTVSDFSAGPLQETGNTWDLAINDKNGTVSFFKVQPQGEEGTVRYSRNGNMTINGEGMLVNTSGDYILDQNNQTILVPDNGEATVSRSGQIVLHDGNEFIEVAQIGLASTTLEDAQRGLKKLGDSLYEPDTATLIERPAETTIASGVVERSAVDPVNEMVSMIEGQRAYDLNMRFLSMQDSSLGAAIQRLNGSA